MTELKDKAIEVIEALTCSDDFARSNSREHQILTLVYKFAHIAKGTCKNPHADWVGELNQQWEAIK